MPSESTFSIMSKFLLCVLAVFVFFSFTARPISATETSSSQPLRQVPDALIEPGPGQDRFIVVVEKETQRLFLYEFRKGQYYQIAEYPCTTGENKGDKLKEGDKKTPEGFYVFNKKALEDELAPIYGVLAFPMDYPNFYDQVRGKQGNGIWMHGTNRKLVPRDSNGCVALNNIDIIDLEKHIRLYDTPIVIYDRVRYQDLAEINSEAARIKAFIEKWRRAWAEKDFVSYQSMYAMDFVSNDGKDYQAWMEHKAKLNELYSTIKVELENLRVFRHQDVIVAAFDQYYKGGAFASDGLKRLYLREKQAKYEIMAEDWQPFPPREPLKFLSAEVRERVVAQAAAAQAAASAQAVAARAAAEAAAAQTAATQAAAAKKALADKARESVRQAVDNWLTAWSGKDMNRYISFYHPEFTFNNMDRQGYREYKERLAGKYAKIKVGVEKLDIKVDGARALVTFIQDYRADAYRDYGLKKLVLVKDDQDWRIREESWQDMRAGAKP